MSQPSVEELERVFVHHVGVTRLEFYRLLEADARRLQRVVAGEGSMPLAQRGLASRALAYLIQGKDAIPDDQLLGHVDDYIVLLVARDELFPDETSELSAEALLASLDPAARARVVHSLGPVLESDESFPASVLEGALDRVYAELRRRRDEPRDVLTLVTTVLPGILTDMARTAVRGALDPDEDRD